VATLLPPLRQLTCVVFPPFAISQTPQEFPLGTRLQKVSYHQLSVSKTRFTSLTPQARTVRISVFTAAGLFPHSIAADTSAELVIVAHPKAPGSTCTS